MRTRRIVHLAEVIRLPARDRRPPVERAEPAKVIDLAARRDPVLAALTAELRDKLHREGWSTNAIHQIMAEEMRRGVRR